MVLFHFPSWWRERDVARKQRNIERNRWVSPISFVGGVVLLWYESRRKLQKDLRFYSVAFVASVALRWCESKQTLRKVDGFLLCPSMVPWS